MNNIIERIEELRIMKGWSKYELAKSIGLSANSVYGWYRTGAIPSLSTVERLCEELDITLEQFFCGVESYKLSDDENKILQEWILLSNLEKSAIMNIIETFKILKRDR